MTWYLFAFGTAIITAILSVSEKSILKHEHSLSFSTAHALLALLFSIPLLFFVDFSKVTLEFIAVIYFTTLLGAVAFWFSMRGLKHLQLSVASPLLVTSLLFTPFIAFFAIGEHLSLQQMFGVFLILLGVFILEVLTHGGKLFPLISLKGKEKYFTFMLFAGLLLAITSTIDKFLLSNLDVFTFILLVHLFMALNSVILLVFVGKTFRKDLKVLFSRDLKQVMFVSFLTVINRMMLAIAISGAFVSVAVAIKHLNTLFATLLAGKLFHEDKIVEKTAITLIMLVGAALLVLS